jgi:hypothetical protein
MLVVGRQVRGMGGTVDVTVDPIVLNGQATAESGALITGSSPPSSRNVWPWVVGALALGAVWYFATRKGGGRSSAGPFVG